MIYNKYHYRQSKQDVIEKCQGLKKILDIGAGTNPFSLATHVVDREERGEYPKFFKVNICEEFLPFDDNEFDFVYCSQTIEDLYSPKFALKEIRRVGKAGYFECPTIKQELTRGVSFDNSKVRGHYHHRWFVKFDKGIHLIPKYSRIEYFNFPEYDMTHPKEWNQWMFWDDTFLIYLHDNHSCFDVADGSYQRFIESIA